jgi:hypothetical protein
MELLDEQQEALDMTFEKYDFGNMITGLMGYVADESQNEFFHISINGEDAMSGPDEIPLQNKDVYKFELTNW